MTIFLRHGSIFFNTMGTITFHFALSCSMPWLKAFSTATSFINRQASSHMVQGALEEIVIFLTKAAWLFWFLGVRTFLILFLMS